MRGNLHSIILINSETKELIDLLNPDTNAVTKWEKQSQCEANLYSFQSIL